MTAFGQSYSGGSGTSVDPYQVSTKGDLKYLSENSGEWSKHFIQTADIGFTDDDFLSGGDFYNGGSSFIPIGSLQIKFTGSYDGNGHSILHLIKYTDITLYYVGFFGYTGSASEIKNLGIENSTIGGVYDIYVGVLAGNNAGTISNCFASYSGAGGYMDIGGLVGGNVGTISNCFVSGGSAVTGVRSTGGLVGWNVGTISNCY